MMNSKKQFLPTLILSAAVLAIVVFSLLSSIALKPTITEAEFPFAITYELDGETVTIEDVYKVNYVPNDVDDNHKDRVYIGNRLSSGEDNTNLVLKQEGDTRIELSMYFYADFLMGDPEFDYFEDEVFEPTIYYYDENETEYSDEETLEAQGVKLISFEYPTPIENKFVFSHFAYFTGATVLPTMLIALLALIVILIFVKKKKELRYKTIDIVSIALNYLIGFAYLGLVTILALLIDIEGGGPDLYYQILYFIPAFSLLCIAASVTLRRKGYGVISLLTQFVGPVVFVLYLFIFYVGGSL